MRDNSFGEGIVQILTYPFREESIAGPQSSAVAQRDPFSRGLWLIVDWLQRVLRGAIITNEVLEPGHQVAARTDEGTCFVGEDIAIDHIL